MDTPLVENCKSSAVVDRMEVVSALPRLFFQARDWLLGRVRLFPPVVMVFEMINSELRVKALEVVSQENKAFGVDVPLSNEILAFSVSAVTLSELIIQLSDDVLPVAMVP
jgi:hypothetical protein